MRIKIKQCSDNISQNENNVKSKNSSKLKYWPNHKHIDSRILLFTIYLLILILIVFSITNINTYFNKMLLIIMILG